MTRRGARAGQFTSAPESIRARPSTAAGSAGGTPARRPGERPGIGAGTGAVAPGIMLVGGSHGRRSCPRWRLRRRLDSLPFLLLILPALSWASATRSGPPANVRPSFGAGYTSPGGMPELEEGSGIGLALEIEQSRAASLVFRLEMDWIKTRSAGIQPLFGPPNSTNADEYSYFTWAAGARCYLRSGATVRPYGELDAGVRVGGGNDPEEEGIVVVPRIGIAVAASGGPGLFLEAGCNFTIRDPERYLLVPIRFGIVFP